ncbi:nicotinate-nucleotide--dimethylbenzimidazole phosphoribosyltransferase [Streptacidiphilus monticola]|uniref:Nicotinate-nucleotide--dimethylbenzimidazole phosphoribosyltransferase n=1 Tax=Streptacidiphilus monticola TaxID=2161674 RepID=A0ABW1G7Q7_9ACTN
MSETGNVPHAGQVPGVEGEQGFHPGPYAPEPTHVQAVRPAYTFLDDEDEGEDELLMPSPQGAWNDAARAEAPAPQPVAPAEPHQVEGQHLGAPVAEGQPMAPSWPPLTPPPAYPTEGQVPAPAEPIVAQPVPEQPPAAPQTEPVPVAFPAEPVAAPAAADPLTDPLTGPPPPVAEAVPVEQFQPQQAEPQAQEAQAQEAQAQEAQAQEPQRRPLHAGPAIPDPSLMTGQVPVRSLADRGPSSGSVQIPNPGTPPQGTSVASPAQGHTLAGPEYLDQTATFGESVVRPAVVGTLDAPAAAQPGPAVAAPVAEASASVPAQIPSPESTLGGAPAEPVIPAQGAAPDFAQSRIAAFVAPPTAAPAAGPDDTSAGTGELRADSPQPEPAAEAAPEVFAVSTEGVAQAVVPAEPVPGAEPTPAEGGTAPVAAQAAAEPVAQTAAAAEAAQPEVHAVEPEPVPVPEAVAEPVVEAPSAVAEPAVAPDAMLPAEPVAAVETTAVAPEAVVEQQPTEAVAAKAVAPAGPEAEVPAEAVPVAEEAPVAAVPAQSEPADAVPTEAPVSAETPAETDEAGAADVPEGEAAPGYEDDVRAAVHRVMRERRDIRNGFRSDPIPHEVLIRVLESAHTAPSVGYSQPWDFVVIRSAKTRARMHELAERQRDIYAESLPKGRAKQFKALKIEAIRETPVNIVVTADRTRGGRHTLGRHTQPQMAPYSAALAVENLWLAARAEGLGVGWVSFFDEEELVRELGLPEHLEVVAYLCVGYVDEFPEEPELAQAGWAKKRPLSWVVHEETYGRRALPGEEPHSVLQETLRGIRPLDAKALGEAWDRQKRMTKPAGSLGMLEIISAQLCGLSRKCPPPIPEPACVAVFAGDHGVHAQGVTPWPQEVTAQMVANFLAGGAVVNAFANQLGAEVCVVDVGVAAELPPAIDSGRTTGLLPRKVRPGTGDMTQGPAMTREEAMRAIEVGIETARDLVAAGNKCLVTGDMGIANTTASAALVCVFTGEDPANVTGRGTGIDDETHARKVAVIRQALALHRPDPSDPIGVLAAVGGLEHAAIAGFLLGAASLRTPVILDGLIAGSAALVAKAIAPEVQAACIAGHRSAEPGHKAALAKLGLRPLIDLDLRLGEGTGALLALPLVQSAARAMHEVATFDSAGVTEKP